MRELDGDVAVNGAAVELPHHFDIAVFHPGGILDGGDVFTQMVQADPAALLVQLLARADGVLELLAGNEPQRESVLDSAPRNRIGYVFFRGKPEDEISHQHSGPLGVASRRWQAGVEAVSFGRSLIPGP